jgi:hypothetical protein
LTDGQPDRPLIDGIQGRQVCISKALRQQSPTEYLGAQIRNELRG